MSPKIALFCLLAMLAPIGVVLLQNPEAVTRHFESDPSQGHLIYFLLPG